MNMSTRKMITLSTNFGLLLLAWSLGLTACIQTRTQCQQDAQSHRTQNIFATHYTCIGLLPLAAIGYQQAQQLAAASCLLEEHNRQHCNDISPFDFTVDRDVD